jgi:hypothetical protein
MPAADSTGPGADGLDEMLRSGGALARAYAEFCDAVWRQPHVPAGVLELCRIRLAQLHGASDELARRHPAAAGSPGIDRKSLSLQSGSWLRDGALSDAELAAIGFTELYAQGAATVTDEAAADVKHHFGEPGLVALIEALGVIAGRIRLGLMLGPFLEK